MNFALSNRSIGQSSILEMQIDHQKALLNHQFDKVFIDSFKHIAGFFFIKYWLELCDYWMWVLNSSW